MELSNVSLAAVMFRILSSKNDVKRDSSLKELSNVIKIEDLKYVRKGDKFNLLDVYYPEGNNSNNPVIVSVHGGGYVYGTKKIYKHYCMYLASLGFTVVNFNYHLAPKHKFPKQLTEINMVYEWCVENKDKYYMDMDNVYMVGDSAGAQLASHYAAIYANKRYAELFPFNIPQGFEIRAIGLNCGMYELDFNTANKMTKDLFRDYVGRDFDKYGDMIKPLKYIDSNYPPTYIMTSYYDFLKDNAEPMCSFLKSKGVESEWKCYGTKEQEYMSHVCHVNMNLKEAKMINKDEVEFFLKYRK